MFALQAGAIRNALVQAGFPMRTAQQLSAILSNSAAEYRTGKVVQDTTPPNAKYVDPATRKQQLTGIDPLADDPDYRTRQQAETEERIPAEQPSDIVAPISVLNQNPGVNPDVVGGPYVRVAQQGNAQTVSLRVTGNGRHPVLNPQVNAIDGKDFRFAVGNEDVDKIRCDITEQGTEVVWSAQLVNLQPMVVVTVEESNGGPPVYGTRRIYAWTDKSFGIDGNGGAPGGGGTSLNVVTSIQWTGSELVGSFQNITVNSVNGGGFSSIVGSTECQ